MSYDFGISVATGGPEAHYIDADSLLDTPGRPAGAFANHTSNVWRMWDTALGDPHDTGSPFHRLVLKGECEPRGLLALRGRRCGDCVDVLAAGVADMEARPDHYRQWNPANGWGDYEGALDYLRFILAVCRAHPDATLEISA